MPKVSFKSRYARALIGRAEARGFSRKAICAALQLDEDCDLSSEALLETLSLPQVSLRIKTLMQDEFGGFAGSRSKPGSFQIMAEFALSAATLDEALDRAFRFYGVQVDGVSFHLTQDEDKGFIDVELQDLPASSETELCQEWWLLYWRNFASWLIGEELPTIMAEVPSKAELQLSEYFNFVGCEWRFSQPRTRLAFPAHFLKKRIVRGTRDIARYVTDVMRDWSPSGIAQDITTALHVKLRAGLELHQRMLTLDELAFEYRVSAQTLRRRLEESGTTFAQLKGAVRRDIALGLLRDTTLSISEISFQAGFAEPTGLSRAVKAWTGLSPVEYRAQHVGALTT